MVSNVTIRVQQMRRGHQKLGGEGVWKEAAESTSLRSDDRK